MDFDRTAISLGNTKEAALYFDHVIPLYLAVEHIPDFLHNTGDIRNMPVDLVPDRLRTAPNFSERFVSVNEAFSHCMFKHIAKRLDQPPHLEDMTNEEWEMVEVQAATEYYSFLEDFGLADTPVLSPGSAITDGDTDSDDVALTLSTLRLIDVAKLSWEQLSEFRRDANARQKLRRLRLFAAGNYAGKSRSYIEDDLQRRLYDYDEEVRRWGFETKHATLTMLLTSKTFGAALSGSLVSALFGAPAISVATAVGGACIEIGRIALEISRRRFALRNSLQDNPVSYIKDAKDVLAPDA
jgi:hypothetical protein